MTIAMVVLLAVSLLYWSWQYATISRVIHLLPRLTDTPLDDGLPWPKISVIMTARDEAASLPVVLTSRLAEEYPNVEFILLDDRSSDASTDIAAAFAERDPRLRVIRIDSVAEGWLGKLNALERGRRAATGEWLLLSDADVRMRPGTLRRLVVHCRCRGLDHLAMLPELDHVSSLLDCLSNIFMRLVLLNLRLWQIEDPGSPVSIGIGAGNFVRRSWLEKLGGFEPLKMEVGDDLALGQLLKHGGARQSAVFSGDLAALTFHRSIGDALRSSERATYTAIGNFSLTRLASMAMAILLLELAPLVVLLAAAFLPLRLAGATLLVMPILTSIRANRFLGRRSFNLIWLPVAEALVAWSLLRAGILGVSRGGIIWRGTFYTNAELKAGRRLRW